MAKIRTFTDMNNDSLRYLSQNTDITYLADGSIAKAMVEVTNLEISRLQDYVASNLRNAYLSTAAGIYLDLFGEMLGVPRGRERKAVVSAQDKTIKFYVESGTLGSRLPNIANPSQGIIPIGTTIQNAAGTITYITSEDTVFPISLKEIYVSADAQETGSGFNIGANQLTVHDLGNTEVLVTNPSTITSGSDIEPDNEYRFRLSRTMTARFGSNATAVQLASISQPGVSRAELVPFSRGAGTFDVLLIPQGNRVSRSTIEATIRAVEEVAAYGISPRIKEPEYVPLKVTVQLTFNTGTTEGTKASAKKSVEQSILRYLANIPLGGELVINQLRSAVLSADTSIKDLQIIELCIDGQARVVRNIKLRSDELFIPCEDCDDPIEVI